MPALTFQSLCDEPLEVVHVFGVFGLGFAQDVPVNKPAVFKGQMKTVGGEEGDLPPALHHKDGGLVVLRVDPVEQLPEVQILMLAELQAVIDEVEAEHRSVRQGEEVRRLPHLLPLLPGEGGQPGAQPFLHAGRVVSVDEERPGEPAQDVVQGALALPQASQTGVTGIDPVRGQRYGQLAGLTGSVLVVVQMPDSRVSLCREDRCSITSNRACYTSTEFRNSGYKRNIKTRSNLGGGGGS